jgi:hypothetical protein
MKCGATGVNERFRREQRMRDGSLACKTIQLVSDLIATWGHITAFLAIKSVSNTQLTSSHIHYNVMGDLQGISRTNTNSIAPRYSWAESTVDGKQNRDTLNCFLALQDCPTVIARWFGDYGVQVRVVLHLITSTFELFWLDLTDRMTAK